MKRLCKIEKERWWNEKCDEIEELNKMHKSREVHEKIKEITGGKEKSER